MKSECWSPVAYWLFLSHYKDLTNIRYSHALSMLHIYNVNAKLMNVIEFIPFYKCQKRLKHSSRCVLVGVML